MWKCWTYIRRRNLYFISHIKVTNHGGCSCITFLVSRPENVWNLDSTLLDRFIVLSLRAASLYMQKTGDLLAGNLAYLPIISRCRRVTARKNLLCEYYTKIIKINLLLDFSDFASVIDRYFSYYIKIDIYSKTRHVWNKICWLYLPLGHIHAYCVMYRANKRCTSQRSKGESTPQ
jgi:hypothetical protein